MSVTATLLPTGRSAAQARRIMQLALDEAGLHDRADEALLLVTELVTNAVVHAGTEIELSITTGEDHLRVDVSDRSPSALPVVAGRPSQNRESGRGLFLLDALAREWGTRHFTAGKSVWFLLGRGARPASPGPAPQPGDLPRGRRDLDWLLGLPADLERRLSPPQVVTELLHRLVDALDLPQGFLVAQSVDDERTWQVVAAHDPTGAEPDVELVRRLAGSEVEPTRLGPDLVLPLGGRAGVDAALVLPTGAAAAGADLTAEDLALARLVGDRLSIVLREDKAHARALRNRGSLALLAEASEMFAGTLDVQLAMTLAAQLVVPRFAVWSAACSVDERGARVVAVAHRDEARSAWLRQALDGPAGGELLAALRRDLTGSQPHVVVPQQLPGELAGDRTVEVLAVPLVARRRLIGLQLVGRAPGSSYTSDDLGLLTDLAGRAALAVDNARLYEERSAVARALQASLLPPTLPQVDTVEFGARYAAAGEGNDVGGDFYDVFSLPSGGWGIAIGDVCGKGAEAASITGMARDVLRLLTRDGVPPPQVLARLNDVILELGERGRFCTTLLGTIATGDGGVRLRFSSAGHPPPVVLRADGRAGFVGRSGTVLGVVDDIEVADDEVLLGPGDALVLYTDGVTERRSGSRMFGDENLLAHLREAAGSDADALAAGLELAVHRFGAGASRDDLAVLVVRCTAAAVPGSPFVPPQASATPAPIG